MYVFRALGQVRKRTEAWMRDYNEELPHDALGHLTPVEYRVFHHPETRTTIYASWLKKARISALNKVLPSRH